MAEDWRLRDEHGKVRSLSTQELRDGLASGAIPSSAQVARPGSEFKPAFSVPELATAAIRAKRTPSIPPSGGGAARPRVPAPHKPPGGPRPVTRGVEVPPAPRSRRRIQNTLVGIHDEDGLPPSERASSETARSAGAPIVAPGGGGATAPRAITQVPRYTPAPASATTTDVVIPRAPRAPSTLAATDHGWGDGDAAQGASIFDDDDRTLVKPGSEGARGPRSQPPPLPPRTKADERPPTRTTAIGIGSAPGLLPRSGGGGPTSPRLVPPRQASTPPPPVAARPSRPPPVPKRTPAPPPARPGTPAPPDARRVTPSPGGVRVSPGSVTTPVPTSGRPRPPLKTPSPAAATPAPPAAATEAADDVPPTSLPDAREAAVPVVEAERAEPATEATPAVPEAARDSVTDDEAPTSKMVVQVVHGAALAMRAALAAPHPDRDGATPPPAGAAPGPFGPAAAADAAAVDPATADAPATSTDAAPSVATEPGAEPASGATSSGPPPGGTPLPLPPSTGVRAADAASTPPRRPTSSAPPEPDEDLGPASGVEVPVSSLFAASAVWIAGLVLVFFVGRCSALDARAPAARRGVAAQARLAMLAAAPAAPTATAEPKPCWVTRQPSRWAAQASKNVPFEMLPIDGGAAMLVGFAKNDDVAVGARVDPKTGTFTPVKEQEIDGGVGRMTPVAREGAEPKFVASPAEGATVLAAPGPTPTFVRFGKSGLSLMSALDATDGAMIHPLEGDDAPNAEQLTPAGSEGLFASFRRGGAVLGAWIAPDGKARGGVGQIAGSGGTVGKPRAGWNGREIAVVFADRPEGGRWQVRLGHAPAGQVPASTAVFDVPAGGPGGDVIAPDVVGLADGRWLVMWTEGSAGSRAIRSITLAPDLAPIGDPIALSPPAGNFGQAQLGVVGSYVTVLFLQKGDEDFELWGAILRCG